jgi:hypothetical protein
MRTIEVTVGPKGEVQLETRGFAGRACQDVAKTLIGSLGQSVAEHLTAEFYRSETACAHTNASATSSETPPS